MLHFPTINHFHQRLRCFKVDSSKDKADLNFGGKVLLPESCLHMIMQLTSGDVPVLMFSLVNMVSQSKTCVGVLEFTEKEGVIMVPSWVYRQLGVDIAGTFIDVTLVNPPSGSYAKFQPLSFDFVDIDNHRVVLEKALRRYPCISVNDCIEISHLDKKYKLLIKETKPHSTICLINCNLIVEFEAAPGYEEHLEKMDMLRVTVNIQNKIGRFVEEDTSSEFKAFQGKASRLDGKKKRKSQSESLNLSSASNSSSLKKSTISGYPDYEWKFGKLHFDKYFHVRVQEDIKKKKKDEELEKKKRLFPGKGKRVS